MDFERTIIIGDIHGCISELEDLLRKIRPSARDQLVCVGDLICKGPDSRAVLDWAMKEPGLRCVRGNHEARFLTAFHARRIPEEKPYDRETYEQLTPGFADYMNFIDSWPLYLEEAGHIVVHAGIDPREGALADQEEKTLTNVRLLPDLERPWYEEYVGEKPVVFGHWVRREPLVRPNAICLDTGCVYGGTLTALLLPENRLVSVPARKEYRKKTKWQP